MGRPAAFDYEAIKATYAATRAPNERAKVRAVAAHHQCSAPTVIRAVRGHVGGAAKLESRAPTILRVDHPATIEKRSIFPTTIYDVEDEWVLKSGEWSAKIGARVTKGDWKGFPIYVLTLEERATCPATCRHWASCYGNHMPMARRWRHGARLEWRIEREVAALELKHPGGFVIRLHSLGDFYSVDYVRLWVRLMDRHTALRIFGYTARVDVYDDPIAREIAQVVGRYWPRFAVRFSNAPIERVSTISIESPVSKPADTFVCPAQWTPSGKKTASCATCALCWSTTRRVAFLHH